MYLREGKCCLCGGNYSNWGHNPKPLGNPDQTTDTDRCCNDCDCKYIIPVRLGNGIDPVTAPEQVVRRYLVLIKQISNRPKTRG